MPTKDLVKKREKTRRWRERVMGQGYGKWLYERRKLRFTDADEFRAVLEHIASSECKSLEAARILASKALIASSKREKALGRWQEQQLIKGKSPWKEK